MPVEWVRYTHPDGTERVDITRLTDGRVMCCLCFEYKERSELHTSRAGGGVDICERCWQIDQEQLAAKRIRDAAKQAQTRDGQV